MIIEYRSMPVTTHTGCFLSDLNRIIALPVTQWVAKGRVPLPNRMNFRKRAKGGVIFNPKSYVADFGKFKQGFLTMKLILSNSYYRILIPPCIYATLSIIKNLQYNFPKMKEGGRGGWKSVWIFSENSSDLVAWPFPYIRTKGTTWERVAKIRKTKQDPHEGAILMVHCCLGSEW